MDPTAAPVPLTTADGIALEADVAEVHEAAGGAVLCHPHPRFGGNRLNAVVAALFRALPATGITALRFDFRPGAGAEGGDLVAERLDVVAALDELARRLPGRPLYVVGYSFGAAVGLGVDHPAIAACVAVAPPLTMLPARPATPVPTLLLVAAHDQFAPAAAVAPVVADWPATTVEIVSAADHFFVGRAAAAADRVAEWLAALAPSRPLD